MNVFVDTSALIAVIDADEDSHLRAIDQWSKMLDERAALFTTNYVILETTALLQKRIGMPAVQALVHDVRPALETVWVNADLHDTAESSVLAANRRQLSLVDITSFMVMRDLGLEIAFTLDAHFAEQGFRVVPHPPG